MGSSSMIKGNRRQEKSPIFKLRMVVEDDATFSVDSTAELGNPDDSAARSILGTMIRRSHNLTVSFSHLQIFVDKLEALEDYKQFESFLNQYDAAVSNSAPHLTACEERRQLWESLFDNGEAPTKSFVPQNRDVVKQLMAGVGFRVTGCRLPSNENKANTRSLLMTSRDPRGVQILVSAIAADTEDHEKDDFLHFDAEYLREFYDCHSNRQGIAVLGFEASDVEAIHKRYQNLHPDLIHSYREYPESDDTTTKVLQVFSYYRGNDDDRKNNGKKLPDRGTVLRFIERGTDSIDSYCALPGLTRVLSTFDTTSQPAYCDHWVSNVHSRTDFWNTLEDVLDFAPKADFNAGVVAAGEAQIESTVIGNSSPFETTDKRKALTDQSQVYLPINNALSEVGHVHGFLKEIGQGIQHVASRVENLVDFVQRCNDMRDITGEGFTFLAIPRSYYGVLTIDHILSYANITEALAVHVMNICEETEIISVDGAVDLALSKDDLEVLFETNNGVLGEQEEAFVAMKDLIFEAILSSRYRNLYSLLQDQITEDQYLGIVRNKVLVDVQGSDVLLQIFTSNILQRNPGDEAPFFEFIQRVCMGSKAEDVSTSKMKPGCGGFGIRNFLTLFLSIEVSKATADVAEAKLSGDEKLLEYAEKRVQCFTNQLEDSNPILTEISDAMQEEGESKRQMEAAILRGDEQEALSWKQNMAAASRRKLEGNAKLMECSARYAGLMKAIREATEASSAASTLQ